MKFNIWYFILLFSITSCAKQVYVADIDVDYIRINKWSSGKDQEISELISPYKQQLDAKMNQVIGIVEREMVKKKPNSALNNWLADLILDVANQNTGQKVDFAVQNYGGIRVPAVAAGKFTIGNAYEVMPFDNKITIISAKGHIVRLLLNRIADYGGWPVSKGLEFRIENGKAVDIKINGDSFDDKKDYVFALPDYIANGGDRCFFLEDQSRVDLDLLIRDAIILHTSSLVIPIPFNNEIRIKTQP